MSKHDLKHSVEQAVESVYGEEDGLDVHGYYSVMVNRKKNRVYVTISCWGEPRFWTMKLIKRIERCDLQFLHVEPSEESVATGVFEIE
jgi:hypothetical protein